MTEKEYFEKVKKFGEGIEDNLERLFSEEALVFADYRPYRLSAFALLAELSFRKNDIGGGRGFLNGTYSFWTRCEGLFEAEDAYVIAALQNKDELDAERHMLLRSEMKAFYGEALSSDELLLLKRSKEDLVSYFEFILEEGFTQCILSETKNKLFCCMENAMQQIVDALLIKKRWFGAGLRDFIDESPNLHYLKEILLSKDRETIVISESEDEFPYVSRVAAKACMELGHEVYYLSLPQMIELEHEVDWIDTARLCLDEREDSPYGTIITPVELVLNGQSIGDNRDYILSVIAKEKLGNQRALFLSTGTLLEQYMEQPLLKKCIHRLSARTAPFYENTIQFGWFGNYVAYIRDIYCTDVNQLIHTDPICRFSIVIPARNSADTLRSTIQTCLEQTYQGLYEIIVSDNSTNGNSAVWDLCQELNDTKIRYIKTPRDLHLPKSFEYAFVHAKGEYIFSLGSDDGMLPWMLEVLDKVANQYPQEEVIQWERGFYAWPGFNGGQQHELVIPREYRQDEYRIYYKQREEYLAEILSNPRNMYSLPMLYINSCFKRSYFDTLMEKTGRLWDGTCQDIYMGIITAAINNQILNLRYPLTIAGMSSGSIGATSSKTSQTVEEHKSSIEQLQKDGNVGGYNLAPLEYLIPPTGTDTWSLYTGLLRAISIGVLPERYISELFDWKQIFMNLYKELDICDFYFDRKIQEMRVCAEKQGEEFLEWFDKTIYEEAVTPRYIPYAMAEERCKQSHRSERRTYKVGKTEAGGLIMDASEYGVKNVYDAVQVFSAQCWQ